MKLKKKIISSFATGCEVSSDGNKISCDCIPGYFGARCESCNAGFYGNPEIPGKYIYLDNWLIYLIVNQHSTHIDIIAIKYKYKI